MNKKYYKFEFDDHLPYEWILIVLDDKLIAEYNIIHNKYDDIDTHPALVSFDKWLDQIPCRYNIQEISEEDTFLFLL